MRLTDRLEEIVQCVPHCVRVIDVGTDHALIPIALLDRNIAQYGVGIDKSLLPLGQARVNRHNAQVTDRLRLVCADGLDIEDLDEQDVVVMAGMGGKTIQTVLQKASWKGTLILQPNRDLPSLRRWLIGNGWYSDVESILFERGQYFWTSRWYRGQRMVSPVDIEFGVQTHIVSPSCFTEWFGKEYNRLKHLPAQAIDRQKLPMYEEMVNRLSNLKNFG